MSGDTRTVEDAVTNPSAAPGELELVRRFVNTLDIEAGTDAIATPSAAEAWLADEGFRTRVSRAELRELLVLREAIRDLVSGAADGSGASATRAVERIARRHPLTMRLTGPDALPLVPSSRGGVGAFIEQILSLVAAARIGGGWLRLKTCRNDACRWLFYDHSRNGSRTWCTMDRCGSQAKMRAYRSRRRSGRTASAPTRN